MADDVCPSYINSASPPKHLKIKDPRARKRKHHESSDAPSSDQDNRKKSYTAKSHETRRAETDSSSPRDFGAAKINGDAGHRSSQKFADEETLGMANGSIRRKSKKSGGKMADGPDRATGKHEDRSPAMNQGSISAIEEGLVNSVKHQKRTKLSTKGESGPSKTTIHKKILSKFEKSRFIATEQSNSIPSSVRVENEDGVAEGQERHGLVPLPQPAPAPPSATESPSYSLLPPWLATPSHALLESPVSFANLGLRSSLVAVLEGKGYTEALPVQSAVLPLLMKGPAHHDGDVCVSAATGSGKTLAYVLPLFSTLDRLPISRLRAIIVVPTRELVKQVREACELCSGGSGLKIGTAVGSTALQDEQLQIMKQDRIYDPGHWQWTEDGDKLTAKQWASFNLKTYVTEAAEYSKTPPYHVIESSPSVDILICTPGRLVDHITSTKGFTLNYLEWLVIDEADRLLNESFQEWLGTVLPALEVEGKATDMGLLNRVSKGISRPIETRKLRKVILSATMTRDISKLNSLRLQKPKLVTVDSVAKDVDASTGLVGDTSLPTLLEETSIPVGDGSEKPLYLLELLKSSIGIPVLKISGNRKSRTSAFPDSAENRDSSDSSDTSDSSNDTSSSASTSSSDEDSSEEDTSESGSSDSDSGINKSTSNKQISRSSSVLIFTKSSEAASRLSRLLVLIYPSLEGKIGTLIKSNKSSTSRRAISAYRTGKVQIIIATDRASRGLDLPLLGNVINYDVPNSLTTYIHRVGRTARAGQTGSAWTLVTHSEGRWFTSEIARGAVKRGPGKKIKKVSLRLDDADQVALKARYEMALKNLEAEVTGHDRA